ncbi:MAG: hypothetical protein V4563_11765 [Pseudomonadota bacterium]
MSSIRWFAYIPAIGVCLLDEKAQIALRTDSFEKGLWISANSRSITLVQINERSPGHIGGLDWELTYFMR